MKNFKDIFLESFSKKFLLLQVTEVFNWLTDTIELPNIHLSGFFLVLTGWLYMKQEMLLKCDYCNRRWSLEPYILHHQLSTSDNKNQAQAVVDPVGQHQRWCAWRSSITESGWESRLSQLLQLKECRCQGKRSRLSTETSVGVYFCSNIFLSNILIIVRLL